MFRLFSYAQLENRLEKYSEISFDIFDTLIKRDVPKPTDVFQTHGKMHER